MSTATSRIVQRSVSDNTKPTTGDSDAGYASPFFVRTTHQNDLIAERPKLMPQFEDWFQVFKTEPALLWIRCFVNTLAFTFRFKDFTI